MQTAQPFYVTEFDNTTTLHPLGMAVVLVMGILTLILPRRFATFPILVVVCFIPTAQRWVLFGLDFTLLRTMVMFGWMRLMMRGEVEGVRLHRLDAVVILLAVVGSSIYAMLRGGDFSALVYRAGTSFDTLGMYFLFRYLVRTWTDLDRFITGVMIISVPVALLFLVEKSTGRNPFFVFGGVPEFTPLREGRLRCRGAYSHPILAGCWWAALVPLLASKWCIGRKGRMMAVVGVTCATTIIITCASSTPVIGLLGAAGGLAMYRVRRHLRTIRWGVVAALCVLHLIMKQPVWHLVSRIDISGGSTGWHRFSLLDQTIKRFGEWWLLGVESTALWGHGLADITNQYVLEAVRGGLWGLMLFIAAMYLCFASVGRQVRINYATKRVQILAWALGTSLAVHALNMIAVSYFGGIVLGLYGTFGMIGGVSNLKALRSGKRKARRAPNRVAAEGTGFDEPSVAPMT
jgi:hypothetical protein